MALFGKKKTAAPGAAQGIPTDRVIQMRQQGVSNDQIIQGLQQEGYTSSQIFDAMSQADIKVAAVEEGAVPPAPPGGPMPPPEAPPAPMPPPMPAPAPMGMPPEMPPPMPAPMGPSSDRAAIEEVAESIIDEKWEELMKNVDKIIAWKEETEIKITKIEQGMKDLKERFEALHTGVLSKISDYDKGIKGVSSDIKAMEQVFKKTLPTFTANVGELSRLTKKLKPKQK